MTPYYETFCVIIIAAAGVWVGRVFSRLAGPVRLWTYILPMSLLAILIAGRTGLLSDLSPAMYMLTTGRARFILLALVITIGLSTALPHLPYAWERAVTALLLVVFVMYFAVLPFLYPALLHRYLSGLTTHINSDGICVQSTDYTCGPAAAVTALRKLGLSAEEGQLAILSHSSPVTGSAPFTLCNAMAKLYGPKGLVCRLKNFDSVDQLNGEGITLAVVKDAFLRDHCVTVLDVTDKIVTIADPAMGKLKLTRDGFTKTWRHCGIVMTLDSAPRI